MLIMINLLSDISYESIRNKMRNKRLVGIIHQLRIGGAERMMINILNYFVEEKIEVHLIIFTNIGLLKSSLHTNIIVHDLKSSSVKKGIPHCLIKIYEIKPNLVFSGIGHVNIALASFIPIMRILLPKTRWISRETSIASLHNKHEKYTKIFNFLYRNVYKNYDKIITQSKYMKSDLDINFPSAGKKSLIINNSVDIDKVKQLASEPINYKFDKRKINLLSVGNLRFIKRHNLILKVLSKLPLNYHLTLVGDGNEKENLMLLAKNLGILSRVKFEGHKTNPYPYIKSADLFILTSEYEGFPNVLLEANSLALPVVAFASPGGIKEIVEENINGFLVENENIDKMVQQIKKAAVYNFDKIKIVERTAKHYSQDIILKKYQELFCLK